MSVIDLKPPLRGYFVSHVERVAYLPAILSDEEGQGHAGRLLLELQDSHDVVVVPSVVSERLAGMLGRRGYHVELHYAVSMCEHVECWVWRRSTEA